MQAVDNAIRGLIIDSDAESIARAHKWLIRSTGPPMQLDAAGTLEDGQRMLAHGDMQFVVLDLKLPDSRGLHTFLSVKEQTPELPILVWATEEDEELGLKAVQAGAQDCLLKGELDPKEFSRAIRNAMERHRQQEKLRELAYCDPLTGLPNRTVFIGHLKRALARSKRNGTQFAVMFLDLDAFKFVNDSLGHDTGDQLLVEVSQRLQQSLRMEDMVARFGGDEFTIFVDHVANLAEIENIVNRLERELSMPFNLNGQEVSFSGSIGVVMSGPQYEDPGELLRDADTAMYRAKALGKARHQIFDKSMHQHALRRLGFEGDLRRAIEQREFELYYQPVICLKSETVVGFEALIRWRRPNHGVVPPDQFIAMAEETGLIVPMGRWVLREGCRQIQSWRRRFPGQPLRIGINVSSRQLSQSDLVAQVDQTLLEFDLEANGLELEITESGIIENPVAASEALEEVRRRGVRLSIDDFGVGYSSLSQLHRFQFDTLKIDRSFVNKLCDVADNSRLFVHAILGLAENLNMEVVAEGIETMDQLRALQDLDCTFGQGFYFSKPLDRHRATEFLEHHFSMVNSV